MSNNTEKIEDKIFASALEAANIKLNKNMYEKANYHHTCRMCGDDNNNTVSYRLKHTFVSGLDTPYLFICEDCYKELDNEKNQ